jgi:hypothetical protein
MMRGLRYREIGSSNSVDQLSVANPSDRIRPGSPLAWRGASASLPRLHSGHGAPDAPQPQAAGAVQRSRRMALAYRRALISTWQDTSSMSTTNVPPPIRWARNCRCRGHGRKRRSSRVNYSKMLMVSSDRGRNLEVTDERRNPLHFIRVSAEEI